MLCNDTAALYVLLTPRRITAATTCACSGRHMRQDTSKDPTAASYAAAAWNINNMPRARDSVLRHMPFDEALPGLTVPRLTVGSCLAVETWRCEQLGLHSISYLHAGAPQVCAARQPSEGSHLCSSMQQHCIVLLSGNLWLREVQQLKVLSAGVSLSVVNSSSVCDTVTSNCVHIQHI